MFQDCLLPTQGLSVLINETPPSVKPLKKKKNHSSFEMRVNAPLLPILPSLALVPPLPAKPFRGMQPAHVVQALLLCQQ